MLTRSFPRFLIQAALLIVVAAIAAAFHLGPLTIAFVVAAAFGIVVGTEWLATRESKPKEKAKPEPAAAAALTAAAAATRPPPPRRTSDPTRPQPPALLRPSGAETADRSRSAPAPVPARPPAPVPQRPASPPIGPTVVERRRWNVFELQSRARTIMGKDAVRDEEISFLLLYLREFADLGGDLNEEFDTFIRESFPDLLP